MNNNNYQQQNSEEIIEETVRPADDYINILVNNESLAAEGNNDEIEVNGNSNGNGAPACLNVQMVFGDIPVCENPNQPAADDCEDACLFCPFDGYDGTTVGYTPDVGINGFCGVLHNDQWIGFVAGDSSVAITALATTAPTATAFKWRCIKTVEMIRSFATPD